MTEGDILAELTELKETFDRIFEYLPANEMGDTDQQAKETHQQENQNTNQNSNQNHQQQQTNQRQSQQKDKSHLQKPWQAANSKYKIKPADAKIRPGFEGPRVIRTKRPT